MTLLTGVSCVQGIPMGNPWLFGLNYAQASPTPAPMLDRILSMQNRSALVTKEKANESNGCERDWSLG